MAKKRRPTKREQREINIQRVKEMAKKMKIKLPD